MDTYIIETREFTWKIHNFTKELEKSNKNVFSEKFSIFLGTEETEWYSCIKLRENKCGIYLYLKESETDDFTVKFEMFVHKLTKEKACHNHIVRTRNEFHDKGWGWADFIPIDKICNNPHKYLKDNTLTIGFKVEITKVKEIKHECKSQYLKMCQNYFNTKSFSDFTIICSDGIEIPTHKFILAAFSTVMERMINIKVCGTKKDTVNIKDINGETMTEILRFIYTTEVYNLKKLAVKLLHGAEKYELNQLKKICIASMIENLTVDNALDYFLLAIKYNSNALLFRSAVFIKLHFKKLRNEIEEKLNKKHLLLLMDNYQYIPGEIGLFESTL